HLLYYPIFWLGYLFFKMTRKTNWYAYVSFRRLFVLTKGKSNDRLSDKLKREQPPYTVSESEGVLGKLNRQEVDKIVENINQNGYYIFESKLPNDKVDALTQFALSAEAELLPPSSEGVKRTVYNREKLLSPRYQFSEHDVLKSPLIQQLTVDPTLFAVAQSY